MRKIRSQLVACPECGKEKLRKPCHIKAGHKYCSMQCLAAYRNREHPTRGKISAPKGPASKLWSSVELTCPACHKTYFRKRGFMEKHALSTKPQQIFCSVVCRKTKVKLTCQNCGKPYERQRSGAKVSKYCSQVCGLLVFQKGGHVTGKDGHKLDSILEGAVCDLLSARGIPHEVHVPISRGKAQTYDFVLEDNSIIEVDGLGQRRAIINPGAQRSFEGKLAYARLSRRKLMVVRSAADMAAMFETGFPSTVSL